MSLTSADSGETGSRLVLEHLKMLCSGDPVKYNFILNTVAQAIQSPHLRPGTVLFLVGQGCGKGLVWELIERLVGTKACFTTAKPEKDVWGKNNAKMNGAIFVRITEVDAKKLAGYVGEIRTLITDSMIRVRSCHSHELVQNNARFIIDARHLDILDFDRLYRRCFIINCNDEKVGDAAYFAALYKAIADENVIKTLFEFMNKRDITMCDWTGRSPARGAGAGGGGWGGVVVPGPPRSHTV